MSHEKSAKLYTTGALAREIGVAAETLRLWRRRGIIAPRKTTTGTAVYDDADRRRALAYHRSRAAAVSARTKVVLYT
jgi:DNA-binding transcriptional MerR regulator